MGLVISLFASYRANDPVFWELVAVFCRLGKNKTKQVVAKPPSLGVIDKTPQRPSLVIPKSEYELFTKLPNGVTIRMKRGTEDLYYFKPSNLGEWNLNKGLCTKCKTPIAGVFEDRPGTWGRHRQSVLP